MAYILGFGATAVSSDGCGTNSHSDPVTGNCKCNVGFDWEAPNDSSNNNCIPGCRGENRRMSPIDKLCHCTPGTRDGGDGCNASGGWFPDCVDINGDRVPGCFFGHSIKVVVPVGLVGAGIGLLVGWLVSR